MQLRTYPKKLILCFIFTLSACGSGDSDSNNTNLLPNLPNLVEGSIVQLDDTYSINQSVELFLYYPNDKISNISWQQTAGDPVTFLAKNSKVIAFTASKAGDYNFSVNYQVNGVTTTLSKSINISQESHAITARLAHEVLSDNKVSLRAYLSPTADENSIKWQQTSGPIVSLKENSTDEKQAIFFNAPNVTKDTFVTFEVSAIDNSQTYTDQVAVLVEPAEVINNNAYFDTRVATVFPFKKSSPYANNLTDCVYSNTLTSSCTLAKLPLIASETKNSTTTPSIEDIMNRVVISHPWMGKRFQEFLVHNDDNDDFKKLLRATTAIVISYDIRPSFYWAATGAIYLDADNFWLTPEERDTINEAPDYRADFGKDLQFVMPWRYVKDNNYASSYVNKQTRVTRTANDRLYRLTSLMYHELAHANDFFPSNEWFSHGNGKNIRILDAALDTNVESDQLAIALPLNSQQMRNLAQVSFAGNNATQTQKDYLPSDVEQFFTSDAATDFYAYSSEREDYAMLFEELMMQNRFGVIRDVAITNQPAGDNITGSDYIVTWGQRGRIGDNELKPRVQFSASRVLPEFDSNNAISELNAPIMMFVGNNWVENLIISPTVSNTSMSKLKLDNSVQQLGKKSPALLRNSNFLPYYQKKLPKH